MHINQNLDESISIVLSFSLAYRLLCFLYLVLLHLIVLIIFLSHGMSTGQPLAFQEIRVTPGGI